MPTNRRASRQKKKAWALRLCSVSSQWLAIDAKHPVLAVTTLPLYPFLGPLWMPYDSAQSAKNRNYYATKEFVEREKRKALTEIDHKMEDKQLTYEQHVREQRLIEAKYSPY